MSKRPSERRVGLRMRILPAHAAEAAAIFAAAGINPIYVDEAAEFGPSFWFGKLSPEDQHRLASLIPHHFYALRGVFIGSDPPPGFVT